MRTFNGSCHQLQLSPCRRLKELAHDLRQATERADKAEQSSKQAKADCAQSAMVRKKLEHNPDDLKKKLLSLESALTTVKKQQQVSKPL